MVWLGGRRRRPAVDAPSIAGDPCRHRTLVLSNAKPIFETALFKIPNMRQLWCQKSWGCSNGSRLIWNMSYGIAGIGCGSQRVSRYPHTQTQISGMLNVGWRESLNSVLPRKNCLTMPLMLLQNAGGRVAVYLVPGIAQPKMPKNSTRSGTHYA